jgi:EAL domain-containing protein (putative c-di-GMP-specific phosphodiesterase class I)
MGLEALLRWRDPDSGIVMPADFLPLAEETGSIIAIGRWVLERSLRDLESWRELGFDFYLSVNLSARQLQDQELVNHVFQSLQAHHVPARSLRVELTEASILHDSITAERALRALRGLGVEIVLDDFGTGNSSLGVMRHFPIQIVKIDRSLTVACAQKRECAAMIGAVVALARTLGLTVIAEGVENEEIRREVVKLGCNGGQGHFFGKPVDAAKVPRIVKPTIPAE